LRKHFAVPMILAALAALTVGCSASDQPADVTSTTAAPRAAATTTAASTTSAASPTSQANQVIAVTVAGGKVTPPPAPVDVKLGSTIVIQVTADVADEVHVHGYDKKLDAQPNQPARLELLANIPGQFEVELESAHLLLFTLRVS